jgi:probable DNA metabolism protein
MRVDLAGPTDVRDFRSQANSLLAHQVAPTDIDWHALASLGSGEAFRGNGNTGPQPSSALHSIVPRSFVRLTELVVLHREEARFDLLYRLLWRLVHEPELAGTRRDHDMAMAQSMAQAVRRDILKARKSLHVRPLVPQAEVELSLAWCEPQHQVTEEVAQWLARQQPVPPWLLASPDRCVLWTGRHLLCGPGVTALEAASMGDAHWHALAARLAARTPAHAM